MGVTQAFVRTINGIGKGARFSAGRVPAAAVVGGKASSLSGGKFGNGAVTGAFSRAFNDENHWQEKLSTAREWAVENGGRVVSVAGGSIQVVSGAALCTTAAGCALGAPLVAHGATKIVVNPKSWKLFRNIPSDYTRAYNVISPLMLRTSAFVDANTVFDTYNRIDG